MIKEECSIAVIAFPQISDFPDFSGFSLSSGIHVDVVHQAGELKKPDLLFLPGTEMVISDLLWMRKNGLEEAVRKLAGEGTAIWGICGGYLMMGEVLEDPYGMEGEAGRSVSGMGLFPTKTVFSSEKIKRRVEGAFSQAEGIFEELSGKSFSGWEISRGRTWIDRENGPADSARFFRGRLEICRPLSYLLPLEDSSKKMHEEGWSRGNVYGCSVHGIFDRRELVQIMVDALRKQKLEEKRE